MKKSEAQAFGQEVAAIMKAEIGKLVRRLEGLEAEIRAGHERLKALEGRNDEDRR